MPGTTPVYGFPYPEPTDLVADYPALGQDLAEDIEAVLPTLGGLNLATPTSIANSGGSASLSGNTVTFTTVSSVSLNGCFTSTYTNYRVLVNLTARSNISTDLLMRMRASGTDNTATSYARSQVFSVYSGTTISVNNNATAGNYFFLSFPPADTSSRAIDVMAPQAAARTFIQSNCGNQDSWSLAMGNHDSTTSFDGFTIYISAGTISGSVAVYGFKK